MQDHQFDGQTGHMEMRRTRLAERQARVGIIANSTVIPLPDHPPREVWTRWPKLRSGRRAGKWKTVHQSRLPQHDAVLSGDMLQELRRDLCEADARDPPVVDMGDAPSPDPPVAPVQSRAQPVIILAGSVLAGALGLIALSLLLD
ncbi:hypothetical protein [Natronohydrobacter thiooxidans]|uniref:hypothetical protein n=1 Tax=Natronohydrobacter thiooxidans TaxID=87172 RepID=UPI000B123B02|nr:hypothetical protein [Natronohydrobacter thiooxidans]